MLTIDASLIGHLSDPIEHQIERGAVLRFAKALGLTNPIYHDASAARTAGYRDVVVPPTYVVTLLPWKIPGITLPEAGVLHGEQSFAWNGPLCVGDRLSVVGWAKDVKAREGLKGRMTIISVAAEGKNQENLMVFQSTAVVVVTEEVAHAGR